MIVQYLESTGWSRRSSRSLVMALATVLTAAIVMLEWRYDLDYSLGVLYAIPVAIGATVLNRWQTLAAAVFCAWIRGFATPNLQPIEFLLRFVMAVLAYGGVGVLVTEVSRNRRALLAALARQHTEQTLRRHAESQLRILVDSSPAAIMTLDQDARVLAVNRAAYDMLGFPPGTLLDVSIGNHVPVFAGALRVASCGTPVRVASTCWAQRANGTHFPAAVWFSTYEEEGRRYLAGIMVDTSEEVRDREHETLRQMADSHRLLAGAVAHEIRNLCSAIRVVTSNLRRHRDVAEDADVAALGTLVESLTRIAAFELTHHKNSAATRVDVTRILEELRVVIEPDWVDAGGAIEWDADVMLPYVQADEHALLQVFLNLSQNSLRAVQQGGIPKLTLRATAAQGRAIITFEDCGPGVEQPAQLFQPFRDNSDGSGLGLYVSRAMMRGFGGDLVYIPIDAGCRFDVIAPTCEVAGSQMA